MPSFPVLSLQTQWASARLRRLLITFRVISVCSEYGRSCLGSSVPGRVPCISCGGGGGGIQGWTPGLAHIRNATYS